MRVKDYHQLPFQAVTRYAGWCDRPVRINDKEAQAIACILEIETAPHIVERLALHGAGHPGGGAGLGEEGEDKNGSGHCLKFKRQ